MGRTAY